MFFLPCIFEKAGYESQAFLEEMYQLKKSQPLL